MWFPIIAIIVQIIAIIVNNWNNRARIETITAHMRSPFVTPAFSMLALYLIIIVQWSVGRKLLQAATQTSTIIAIIVKISPIIACALAIHVESELDFSIQIGLGTQHAMSDTRQTSPSARGEHMIAPTRTE